MVITIVTSESLESQKEQMEEEANSNVWKNKPVHSVAEYLSRRYSCAVTAIKLFEGEKYVLNCFRGF